MSPVVEAIGHFRRRLTEIRTLYDERRIGLWQEQAEGLAGRIRTAWERAVEEVISPVFQRFDHDVDTKKLPLLTVLTEDDCRTVDEARGRCSQLQHSAPAIAGSAQLTPDAIDAEINELETWFTDVRARQERVHA